MLHFFGLRNKFGSRLHEKEINDVWSRSELAVLGSDSLLHLPATPQDAEIQPLLNNFDSLDSSLNASIQLLIWFESLPSVACRLLTARALI